MSDPYQVERPWLIFFRCRKPHWWFDHLLDPGFRHISAASYYADTERWVFFDPAAKATVLLVLPPGPHVDAMLGHWAEQSAAVLRFTSRTDRSVCPLLIGCVASIKALLGISAPRALGPRQLFAHLVANGAEPVEIPSDPHVSPVLQTIGAN